jgi:hypothetical protein
MTTKHCPPTAEVLKQMDEAWDRALQNREPTDDELGTMHLDRDAHLAPMPPAKPPKKPGLKAWASSKKKS